MTAETMPVGGIRPVEGNAAPADLVIRNAKIYAGSGIPASSTAVAITQGQFTIVGDERDVESAVGPRTRVVDGLGRRMIPGLNDSHLHAIRGGLNYFLELRWDGVDSIRTALRMLAEQVERTPAGQWVRVVGGWTASQFIERRMPTLVEINAIAPETPVMVIHLYQSAMLNKAALRAVGYSAETARPPGGDIVRDHAGNPSGVIIAAPAATILYQTLGKGPSLSPEEQLTSTRHFLGELNRFGLTSAIDAGGGLQSFPDNYAAVTQLATDRALTVRIAYHLFPQTPGQELDDLRRWVGSVSPHDGDQWLRANGAGENLVWATADFENFAEPRPELDPSASTQLEHAARLLLEHDWGFRMHATYDETILLALGVFDRLRTEGLWGRVPWIIDHAETATNSTIDRIAGLGGAVSIQNRMMFQGDVFASRYGREAASSSPPIAAMRRAGLLVAAGTDATRVSSYNPWRALSWLVTGRTIGGSQLRSDQERVSREVALEMYTEAGAKLTDESDVKGTIEVGKYADLALLSDDYFSVPAECISRIESVLTVVGGRIVYAAGDYDGMAEPLPAISPDWSPVARFGGYHAGSGLGQAAALSDVAHAAEDHRRWRVDRGETVARPRTGIIDDCF